MDERCTITAIQVGGLAREVLSPGTRGSVTGVTSSGIFLISANKILFITQAQYNSPYNIQVETIVNLSSQLIVGDTWKVDGEKIILGKTPFQIDLQAAHVWMPLPLQQIDNSKAEQIERMNALLDRFSGIDRNKGWLFLKDDEKDTKNQTIVSEAQRIRQLTENFLDDCRQSDLAACLESARHILGLGGGLTPSGDDWLTGFFLYFARQNKQDKFMLDLGAAVTSMAYERTTKISANRIEAACRGWAEEMFLEVLDHLFTSSVELSEEQVQRLVNFGHSTGVDTYMGIYSALSLG